MALMSNLSVGISGLRVSQYALNATAHNLANVDTEGYVRQQTLLTDTQYLTHGWTRYNTLQTGLGVSTWTVTQVRDIFLDKSYRQEVGRQGFYDSQNETVREIEDLFGELQGVAFQDSLEDIWVSLQELAKQPDSIVARASLIETAVGFVERSENIYKQLKNYQLNLNTQIRDKVTKVNEIGARINTLNDKIVFSEANNVEHANDMRDERNKLLDELSQIIKITYKENQQGRVTVMAEGIPIVTSDTYYPMSTMTVNERYLIENPDADLSELNNNEKSDMLVPVWPNYGNVKVFDFTRTPSSNNNTDIGSLKGLLYARGDMVAKYVDIPVAPVKDDYIDSSGELDTESYDNAVAVYDNAVLKYNNKISPSIILNTQAQFDQLIHGVVTTINDILCPNKEVTLAGAATITFSDGTERELDAGDMIYILDEENAGVGVDGPPATMGEELFSRKSKERYSEVHEITIVLEDGTVQTVNARIYAEEDPKNNYSLYTLGEIKINQALLEDKSKLPLSSNTETGDYDMAQVEKLISAWQDPFATLSPNTLTMNTFNEYYNAFISELATNGEQMAKISENQAAMVNTIDNQRKEVSGVSSDEELTNIIKFQHAYNAAARYINVVDEMLEIVLTRL